MSKCSKIKMKMKGGCCQILTEEKDVIDICSSKLLHPESCGHRCSIVSFYYKFAIRDLKKRISFDVKVPCQLGNTYKDTLLSILKENESSKFFVENNPIIMGQIKLLNVLFCMYHYFLWNPDQQGKNLLPEAQCKECTEDHSNVKSHSTGKLRHCKCCNSLIYVKENTEDYSNVGSIFDPIQLKECENTQNDNPDYNTNESNDTNEITLELERIKKRFNAGGGKDGKSDSNKKINFSEIHKELAKLDKFNYFNFTNGLSKEKPSKPNNNPQNLFKNPFETKKTTKENEANTNINTNIFSSEPTQKKNPFLQSFSKDKNPFESNFFTKHSISKKETAFRSNVFMNENSSLEEFKPKSEANKLLDELFDSLEPIFEVIDGKVFPKTEPVNPFTTQIKRDTEIPNITFPVDPQVGTNIFLPFNPENKTSSSSEKKEECQEENAFKKPQIVNTDINYQRMYNPFLSHTYNNPTPNPFDIFSVKNNKTKEEQKETKESQLNKSKSSISVSESNEKSENSEINESPKKEVNQNEFIKKEESTKNETSSNGSTKSDEINSEPLLKFPITDFGLQKEKAFFNNIYGDKKDNYPKGEKFGNYTFFGGCPLGCDLFFGNKQQDNKDKTKENADSTNPKNEGTIVYSKVIQEISTIFTEAFKGSFNYYWYLEITDKNPAYFLSSFNLAKEFTFERINDSIIIYMVNKIGKFPQYHISLPDLPKNLSDINWYLSEVEYTVTFLQKTENVEMNRYDLFKKYAYEEKKDGKNEKDQKIIDKILKQCGNLPISNWNLDPENIFRIADKERKFLKGKISRLKKDLKTEANKSKNLTKQIEELTKTKDKEISDLKKLIDGLLKQLDINAIKASYFEEFKEELEDKRRTVQGIQYIDYCENYIEYFSYLLGEQRHKSINELDKINSISKTIKDKYKKLNSEFNIEDTLLGIKQFKDHYNSISHPNYKDFEIFDFAEAVDNYMNRKPEDDEDGDDALNEDEEEEKKGFDYKKEILGILNKFKEMQIFVFDRENYGPIEGVEVEKYIRSFYSNKVK